MTLYQLVMLALIQGATEWLPVSSSAHLILFPKLTGLPDQGPLIDAMAHLGSLGAVFLYFRADIARILQGFLDLAVGRRDEHHAGQLTENSRLFLLIAIATPPGLIVGAAYELTAMKEILRSTQVIAAATIGFGILLWVADRYSPRARKMSQMTVRDALMIGAAQALAFIPGASRSGTAMTAARAMGFRRGESARIAMLMGVPLIGAVGGYALLQLALGAETSAVAADGALIPVTLADGLLVAILSFFAAWASIAALMALLKRTSFTPFVIYRLGLGFALLAFFA